jgi:hypothetical protein
VINLKKIMVKDIGLADLKESLLQHHHYKGGRNQN